VGYLVSTIAIGGKEAIVGVVDGIGFVTLIKTKHIFFVYFVGRTHLNPVILHNAFHY
jgi:hypothetical protein